LRWLEHEIYDFNNTLPFSDPMPNMPEGSTPLMRSSNEDARQEKQDQNTTPFQPREKKINYLPDITTLPLFLVALICIIGCIVVVHVANGKIVGTRNPTHWVAVQPTVLVALFAAVFGLCVKLIFASGVSIVWWRAFERHDVRLADLHYIFKRGTPEGFKDVWEALSNRQAKAILAVFTIVTAVDLSDGPLLQRSIRSCLSTHSVQYDSSWNVASDITDGWSGRIDSSSPAGLSGSVELDLVLQNWYLNRTLEADGTCEGTCDGPLRAAGIDVNCSFSEQSLDLTDPRNVDATLYSVSFNRTKDAKGTPVLDMTHTFMHTVDQSCNGTIGVALCSIRTATVEYNVHQAGRAMQTARYDPYPRVISLVSSVGDKVGGQKESFAGGLAALDYFGYYYFQSNGTLTAFIEEHFSDDFIADGYYSYEPSGNLVKQHIVFDFATHSQNSSCTFRWKNATDDILWTLHDVMLRMAWSSSYGMYSSKWAFHVSKLTTYRE
jgi:hypothetical protein